MTILSVRYIDYNNTSISVDTIDDAWIQSWPSGTRRDVLISAWLSEGNTITPYDPYFGMGIDEVRNKKHIDGMDYGRKLVDSAKSNPYDLVFTNDTEVYTAKVLSKRRLRVDKLTGDKILTIDEELQAERDEVLQEYEVLCIEASEEFDEIINEASTIEEVAALDPETSVTWPIWTPPA